MKLEENDKLILITNDDGLYAGGIRTLIRIMEDFGKLVVISATESRSAMSQALTVKQPPRVKLLDEDDRKRIYACSGTPADGVKLAVNQLLDRKPDLIASGINHGSNASASILYSGTMAAALEGCLYDITSVGFSLTATRQQLIFQDAKSTYERYAPCFFASLFPQVYASMSTSRHCRHLR